MLLNAVPCAGSLMSGRYQCHQCLTSAMEGVGVLHHVLELVKMV